MGLHRVKPTAGDSSWFTFDRFGMFIHFGAYAAIGRGEWVMQKERIPVEKYERYARSFDPDLFSAREWVRAAKAAGMRYIVLTAKHHDGFCMYDSKFTDYKITNTPFGRDVVREYVDACREEGMKVGLYYSLLDWHHPEYPIDGHHPLYTAPDALERFHKARGEVYVEYLHNQVRELLTEYGRLDVMWFDYSISNVNKPGEDNPLHRGKGEEFWQSDRLVAMIRELQPHVMIDNRLYRPWEIGDIMTPEQTVPNECVRDRKTGERVVWESCYTMGKAFGYAREEHRLTTPRELVELLISAVSRGGNFLLNVAPTGRGAFPRYATEQLAEVGAWLRLHGPAIYGCTEAEERFTEPDGCRLTERDDGSRLYVHMLRPPIRSLTLTDIADRVAAVRLLSDGAELAYTVVKRGGELTNDISIAMPEEMHEESLIPVIEIVLD